MSSMAPEVATFSDVTLSMLSQHGIVKVKDDQSMIISEYLMEIMSSENLEESLPYDATLSKDSLGTTKFIQTCFQDSIVKKEETTWEPIEGCIDNTLSDTTTTISRTVEGKISNKIGPSLTLSAVGLSLGFDPRISSSHSFQSKFSCDVDARQKMQVFSKHSKVTISNVKQRRFSAAALWKRPFKSFEMSEWEDLDDEHSTYYTSSSRACVTNPKILQC
ncbi:uncharacterized protein CXQ87_004029 [Candidozyma duobushaemuli]|uniref:Uncharacterized protein n=1 Tax=Candidozyma duobushaemuli TaxID=1231522 RepID=A0A2V1AG02_9ASCO|nr:uncharacterized protein CXQ87_004029 [[Candida] duobushaemulonis]PVH16163.1 hypothetical protein CXQ87_004029 [[Candida] duobushaemulonis]